ncbi:MAG: amidohydrolase family protein [Acidobacteria bacterium]|nr:amidohydrolase family protein [Acidobacteriota bacterium]MDA1236934.1 amidohydrolase family protein [Acidobacteriota bacterium]
MIDRRQFLLAAAAAPVALAAPVEDLWGGPVIDIHAHTRSDANGNATHCDGAGISHAILLTRANQLDNAKAAQAAHPGRFHISASTRLTDPNAAADLTKAVKDGAIAFGELKDPVQADGPELQRLYALAGELDVPIMVHFQEVPNSPEGVFFANGIKNLPKMLEKYPKTKFVAHANSTWGNITAVNNVNTDYPTGKIVPGGLTDKMLGDYANLYADLSANSGQNALSRDPEFTTGFLERHQDKLLYGSDCPCRDGKGQGRDTGRLIGKCLSRETLSIVKKQASPAVFRKIAWENTHRVYKIKA